MKKFFVISFCLMGIIFSQEKQSNSSWQTYSSRGLFDHRSGLAIYSVSNTKKILNNSEFFASLGTMGFINSVASGIRFNQKRSNKNFDRSYFVVSARIMAFAHRDLTLENLRFVPTFGIGLEKDLSERSSINIGIFSGLEYYSDERGVSAFTMPTVSYITRW
tara:strand:+ start:6815 stop:7300 length:486 start_codon:yes stop_codon:yes gene_type:complete